MPAACAERESGRRTRCYEDIPVVFDAAKSTGCNIESVDKVSHSANGKAIGIVGHPMSKGSFEWKVSIL